MRLIFSKIVHLYTHVTYTCKNIQYVHLPTKLDTLVSRIMRIGSEPKHILKLLNKIKFFS